MFSYQKSGTTAQNELACFYFASSYEYILSALYLWFIVWKKRNYEFPFISLFFYHFLSCVSGWLLQESNKSKKQHDRVPCSFMFLRPSLPPFCNWSKFWLKWKASPCRAVRYPTYSNVDGTHFESLWFTLWVHWNSVFMEHHKYYTLKEWQGTVNTHITNIFSTYTHALLFH